MKPVNKISKCFYQHRLNPNKRIMQCSKF